MKKILFMLLIIVSSISLAACQYESDTIVLGEGDWQSNEFYNQVVKFLLEEGYDRDVDIKQMEQSLLTQTLSDGTVDANVETWSGNILTYTKDIADVNYREVGVNFDDNYQGIYIPKYLAEAYNITSITDLIEHKALFPDPEVVNWNENSDKAVIFGGPSGWGATNFLTAKFENEEVYPGLVEHFDFRSLESTSLLNTTLTDAYQNNKAWAGYNWEPTMIMGLYDMVLLEDNEPFNLEAGTGNLPTSPVTVTVSNDFYEAEPELTQFFSKFSTSSKVASDALAYMSEQELSAAETAQWWIKNNVETWGSWVSVEAKDKVLEKLEA